MNSIAPITPAQQRHVIAATEACIHRAGELLQRPFDIIPVHFDLRGRAAGMYRVQGKQRWIRYNPYLFAKYFDENLGDTVPHEVAHYVTDMLYGLRRVRAHGPEWRELADMFGANAKATCHFSLDGIPVRTQQRFPYRCDCATHEITTRRHNLIRRRKARYVCKTCNSELRYAPEKE